MTTQLEARQQAQARRRLLVLTAAALVLQLALAAVTESYPYDASCFTAWAQRMAQVGPGNFYAADYFCDYPPGYMLLLWLPGKLLSLPFFSGEKAARVVLALWPALAGAGIGLTVYAIGVRHIRPAAALRVAAAALFCPAILYDTGIWGQIDSVFALAVLLCFAALEQDRWLAGALWYGAALAIKPQALLAGPALAACYLVPLCTGPDARARLSAVKRTVLGAAAAIAVPAACGLPFWGLSGLWKGLAEKYFTTTTSYPYATINACNLMAFLGGEWVAQTEPVRLGGLSLVITWQQLGVTLLVLWTTWCAFWVWRSVQRGRFSPLLTAALYTVGVFTLSHRMHERYLVFAVVLLLAAAARFGSRRLLALAGGLSLTSLLNMALVYSTVNTDDEFLSSAVSQSMLRAVGLAETVLFVLLAVWAWRLCCREEADPIPVPDPAAARTAPAPQPAWTRRERLFVAGLTLAVAAVSFFYLGDLTAPRTCVDTNGGESVSYTVRTAAQPASLWVYPGISSDNGGSLTVTDSAGTVLAEMQLSYGNPFTWTQLALTGPGPYTITVTDGQVFELEFRDEAGQRVELAPQTEAEQEAAASALFDEADRVPDTFSQLNSFYFDEIYHARTGYETLHGMQVYETTHPPLGKDLIALGIAIFGMTGFGWRFSGTLFGVLLVPLLYCFVRRLTRKPRLAAFAGILLALDFMRFSQSRLATIDTYAVFFILLSANWMVWYAQKALTDGIQRSLLPMVLCGTAFGLGCASKWTGIYAGAGLAVLYFGVLYVRYRQLCGSRTAQDHGGRTAFAAEARTAILGGFACFVFLPLAIYLASYLPYLAHDPGFGLSDWWNCQTYMYWYHSTLEATHPFSSAWYAWLLDLRPVWYYMGSGLEAGTYASIAGFVSPVVALAGLAAWLRLSARQLVGKGSRTGGALIVLLLSALLPWVLVTRCTFLYHYFPCVPFLIAAAAVCLGQLAEKHPAAARRLGIGILAAAAVLFIWFYPVLSGLPVSRVWAASLKWLGSWGFYIL